MHRYWIKRFAREDAASTTVEFVSISLFFFIIVFIVMEIALALFWWQTAEVAAQIGARYAVVWDPAVTLPAENDLNTADASASFGESCNVSAGSGSDPCTGFTTVSCAGGSGGGCNTDPTAFNDILAKMQGVFGALQASNLTITYSYAGLGFAGGPLVPAVTVQISGVPFPGGLADLLGTFYGPSSLSTVPTMSATFTGEDLSSAAAGS